MPSATSTRPRRALSKFLASVRRVIFDAAKKPYGASPRNIPNHKMTNPMAGEICKSIKTYRDRAVAERKRVQSWSLGRSRRHVEKKKLGCAELETESVETAKTNSHQTLPDSCLRRRRSDSSAEEDETYQQHPTAANSNDKTEQQKRTDTSKQ